MTNDWLTGVEKVRLMGAGTTDDLRDIAAALHFAGIEVELRVGLDGDGWSWRTPLMNPDQLDVFLRAAPVKIAGASKSQTTPTHANVLAVVVR